ncbi:mediator of RNA polymerase ii transcription subunit 20 [Anaeramoeba ignava]|uniref:Mediator of RNA polymerase ii transcription subunit 20 n=1 Tax=Anaeramoeba ignava TaxID=1746090 RepID=A0A9Q0LA09_ANAIG|nr:mediator of RNA polymerase ii transcription subunit 20 [Anaeramoeba ignava]
MSKSDPILERLDFIKVKQIEIVGSEYSLSDFILHFGNIIISSKNVGILLEIEFVPSRFYHEGFKKMVSEIKENIYKQIPDPLKVLEFFSDKKLMVGKPKFEKKSKRKEDPNQNPNQDQDQNQNQNQEKKGNNDLIVDDNNNEIQIEIENENENKNKNKINKENQNENDSIPQNILTQLSNPEIDSSVNALRTSNSKIEKIYSFFWMKKIGFEPITLRSDSHTLPLSYFFY